MSARSKKRRESRDARGIRGDLGDVDNIIKQYFNTNPLPRLDESTPADVQDIINARQAYGDPRSATFAGRRSADVSDILSRMKGGLDGYTSAELQGMREQQSREMNRNLIGGLKALASGQAKSMVYGATAAAQRNNAIRADTENRGRLEQDLFVKNADERRSRLDAYGNAVTGAEANEWTRGQSALKDWETATGSAQDVLLGKQKFNIGQESRDRATNMATRFGLVGMLGARRNQATQNKIMAESARRGGSVQPQSQGGSYAEDLQKMIDMMKGGGEAQA